MSPHARKEIGGTRTREGSCDNAGGESLSAGICDLYSRQEYRNCLKQVKTLVDSRGTSAPSLPVQTLLIGARSAYRLGDFNTADAWVRMGLEEARDDPELLSLHSLNLYEFRDFANCIAVGERALDAMGISVARQEMSCESVWWRSRLLDCVGMSHYNLGNYAAASRWLKQAIEWKKDDPELYISLSMIEQRIGGSDARRRVISEGLVYCGDKRELQKLAAEFLGDERISLCMIVKNEEEMLPKCLESVSEAVDEIIVVDTGSTDNTVEIARRFGARVYHHPWESNFSLHRNQSLGYATGDWVFIMDADEVLVKEDREKLQQATRIPDMNIISVSVHNQHLRTGELTSFLPSVRLWRRKLNGYYEGIVHNELRLPASEPVLRADIRLIHYGYGLDWEKMKEKIARSKALLQKQLDENPDNAFANFNYAQILRGEYQTLPEDVCRKILVHAGRAVENTDPALPHQRHIHLMALDQMASAHFFLREYSKAEECEFRALALEPHYLDALFTLGHTYAARRDFPQAINAYERYIESADAYDPGSETGNLMLIHAADQATAYFSLGLIYEEMLQPEPAIRSFEKILEYKSDHADLYTHLAVLYLNKGDRQKAESCASKRLESCPGDVAARSVLAEAAHQQGLLSEARRHCEAILERDASHRLALELLIRIERESGDYEAALQFCERLLVAVPKSYFALTNRAEILMALHRYQEAADVYQGMALHYPADAGIANDAGNCYFKLNNYRSAINHYTRALALNPQMATALRNLGYTYYKDGDLENAVQRLSNYLDHAPEDTDILYLVARLHFDRSDYTSAVRYIELCLRQQPGSAELVSFLADCYLKLGHVESARLGYQKAVALNPRYKPALAMLTELERVAANTTAVGIEVTGASKS